MVPHPKLACIYLGINTELRSLSSQGKPRTSTNPFARYWVNQATGPGGAFRPQRGFFRLPARRFQRVLAVFEPRRHPNPNSRPGAPHTVLDGTSVIIRLRHEHIWRAAQG